ncbi:uncharacterized protein LTR77_007328 [Saxophila tyrrhenica]|uniref:AAA+ ATPase domain-containing protein n=1 Tax=Saxophila tyrrhenica TaxID=1690608 RepID=A0AAV9P7C2_9PEZI|nr:hypothetical protein LTR77_007328 [Saxophila tyrrhenica]
MNGDKSLHPFFARPHQQTANGTRFGDEASDDQADPAPATVTDPVPKKKRKPKASQETNGKTQKTLQELVNPKSSEILAEGGNLTDGEEAHHDVKKRRRTSEDEFVEISNNDGPRTPKKRTPTPRRHASPHVIIPASSPLPSTIPVDLDESLKTPPKKMLRLNASGKFSSPVSKKPDGEEPTEQPRRRGRPRKSKETKPEQYVVVVMAYSTGGDIGARIDRIMAGTERHFTEVKSTPKKKRGTRKQQPSKPTHPFFTGKPESKAPLRQESPRKASAVTPGKLRRQALGKDRVQPVAQVQDVWTSALLKDRLMMKHSGARDPSWPDRESTHVRGLTSREQNSLNAIFTESQPHKRKRKAIRRSIPADASLLTHFSSQLVPEAEGELRRDGFREPHRSLKIPKRLLIPGEDLASRVQEELHALVAAYDEDELSRSSQASTHPALRKLLDAIPRFLTAFDEGRGDSFSWSHKYAPSTAAEVLQPSQEMSVLRKWLTSLTVSAVESNQNVESKTKAKQDLKPKKKRKRRADDLNDFLVDSDEEVHDMDELADPEAPATALGDIRSARSIVQVATDGVKLSNAVLLSGPHGCGKTAAAYAVAKELGFKVFEISPCERRSGKDVLEKVGDMTENHLVKHHGTDPGETSSTEEPSRNEEAFQRDLASGRQGKMSAFFKPQANTKQAKPKKKSPTAAKAVALQAIEKAIKKPAKDQQQSLILLEEVDILFKDDKDFWHTVFKLIVTSKRPFIMTCNDEAMVPLQAMSLYAILRFEPPPVDLAVDYLLLMAAAEGHLVKREAVASLYTSKLRDLRASIAELDFWCQIGVGDPKGGLSWIYQRYPLGSDLDEQGRRLRVVSQGTFDVSAASSSPEQMDEPDRLLSSLRESNVDMPTVLGWHGMTKLQPDSLPDLKAYANFANSLSAIDVYCGYLDRPSHDNTQKPMRDKARSQYTEGMQLLQSDEAPHYTGLGPNLSATSALYAFRSAGLVNSTTTLTDRMHSSTTNPPAPAPTPLSRHAFACFDPISAPIDSYSSASGLTASSFDGPLNPIATDLAPYVRSVVSFDLALAEQRERLDSVTSSGRQGKQARTTRAARSALEGSQRASTRKERWFGRGLDYGAVLATGGEGWSKIAAEAAEDGKTETEGGTPGSSMEVEE